eukprot:COSAG05_NODE_1124_length_5792_cov_13.204286_2_plen_1379_part_00
MPEPEGVDELRDLRGERCILGNDVESVGSTDSDGLRPCPTCSSCDCEFGREARLSATFLLTPSSSASSLSPPSSGRNLERSMSSPTGSPRGRPRKTSSEEEKFKSMEKRNRILHLQVRDSAERQRTLEALIKPEDLKATAEDVNMHGENVPWQLCGVNDPCWGATDEEIRRCRRKVKRRKERAIEVGDIDRDDESSSDGEDNASATADTSTGTGTGTGDISGGANGMVWRALWQDRIHVAIKTYRDRKLSNTDEIQLFLDLRHPNIVTCYGILKQKEGLISKESIVTERCTTTLDAFLKDNSRWFHRRGAALTADDRDMCKLTILEHVALGLERLHSECVLHRDLKPLNILLEGAPPGVHCQGCGHEGRWKICDFGEAAILRTPALSFDPAMPWSGQLDPVRFHKITSVELTEQGAQYYCWLHPGETFVSLAAQCGGGTSGLTLQMSHSLASLGWPELQSRARELGVPHKWVEAAQYPHELISYIRNPFPNGALVYSFSDDKAHRDPRDCVFLVNPHIQQADVADQSAFPKALRPFSLVPVDPIKVAGANKMAEKTFDHVQLDLKGCSYTMDLKQDALPDQLLCLRDLYGSTIHGRISTPHRVSRGTVHEQTEQRLTLRKSVSYPIFETRYHADLPQEHNARTGKVSSVKSQWRCDATGATLGTGPGQTPSLWLNLSDGFIGGGRNQYGGTGNDGALRHYENMLKEGKNYPLCVKLGTITEEGADVYSYAKDEDDTVLIPPKRLAELLQFWGIDTMGMEKTEKDMREMELADLDEAFFRTRHRIPKNATHYVYAYQLEPWTVDDKFKRLDVLKQDSGEISLASYGGCIYFSAQEEFEEEDELPTSGITVRGINAFSLITQKHGRPRFAGGTIDRHDNNLTGKIDSPELFSGMNIGLESDIYSFGIVAWEVFTRLHAWHWVPDTSTKKFVMQSRVEAYKRPKAPAGLHPDCAYLLRWCLHHDPSGRPDAKNLIKYISKGSTRLPSLIEKLRASILYYKDMSVTERSMRRNVSAQSPRTPRAQVEWAVVMPMRDAHAACWKHGRYSLDRFQYLVSDSHQPLPGNPFVVEITPQHEGLWEENALVGDEKQPLPPAEESTAPVAVAPLGIQFDITDEGLRVKRIVKRMRLGGLGLKLRTLAPRFCDIQPGCVLTRINDRGLKSWGFDLTFKEDGSIVQDGAELESEPQPEQACDQVPGLPLGGKFKTPEQGNTWPYLGAISPDSAMATVQELKVGCRLLQVNGESVDGKTFQNVLPELKVRPLTLRFLNAETSALCKGDLRLFELPLKLEFRPRKEGPVRPAWPTAKWAGEMCSDVPSWIQAGLAEIDKVKKYEDATRTSMRAELEAAQDQIARLKKQLRLVEQREQSQVLAEGVPVADLVL